MPGSVHIVDDDASFRTAMERRLTKAGYEVATYASAEHLLDRLPSDSVLGCILLDVRMPGQSGLALQERWSELGSMLPIIFLTGHPDIAADPQGGCGGFSEQASIIGPTSSGSRAGLCASQFDVSPEDQTGHRSHSYRSTDAARAAGLRTCHSRRNQQARRPRVGLYRTHHQGSSPQTDGEDAGPTLGGTCIPCRAGRRSCVGYLTDSQAEVCDVQAN
jgi:CheY-like chemotaxis protein